MQEPRGAARKYIKKSPELYVALPHAYGEATISGGIAGVSQTGVGERLSEPRKDKWYQQKQECRVGYGVDSSSGGAHSDAG